MPPQGTSLSTCGCKQQPRASKCLDSWCVGSVCLLGYSIHVHKSSKAQHWASSFNFLLELEDLIRWDSIWGTSDKYLPGVSQMLLDISLDKLFTLWGVAAHEHRIRHLPLTLGMIARETAQALAAAAESIGFFG